MMPMPIITITNQLLLRPLEEADAPELFAVVDHNRTHLSEFLPWVAENVQESDSLDFIRAVAAERRAGRAAPFGIFLNGKLVGHIGLKDIVAGHKAEIGYWLAEDAGGQGIMMQAAQAVINYGFKELKLVRLLIRFRSTNPRSAAIAKRLGFVLEGTERRGELHSGKFYDMDYYGLLAP